jgi:hypothetical protein
MPSQEERKEGRKHERTEGCQGRMLKKEGRMSR